MEIRILVFEDGTEVSRRVVERAQKVWVTTDHINSEHIYTFDVNQGDNQELAETVLVTGYPTIVFAEVLNPNQILTIAKIVGLTSEDQIRSVYNRLLDGERPEVGNGTGETPKDVELIIKGDEDGLSIGTGIFNVLNSNLPEWLLWGLTLYSGYKTVNSQTQLGQYAWGGATAVTGYTLYVKSKLND